MAMALAEVLNCIWSAEALPIAERRRLCRAAVLSQVLPRGANEEEKTTLSEDSEKFHISLVMETLMDAAGQQLGSRQSITSLKAALRARGRSDLASRASRLSKYRNTVCHPDVGLHDAVMKALSCPTTAEQLDITDQEKLADKQEKKDEVPPAARGLLSARAVGGVAGEPL